MTGYWLFKTEPQTYSFAQLQKDRKTHWNGVRNFQARNYLREAKPGDLAIIYHSGDERAAVGIAEVVSAPYPDPDPKKPGEWVQIDLEAIEALRAPVSLAQIKSTPALKELPLIKQSRLSCMPIRAKEFETLCKMGLCKMRRPSGKT